MYYQPYSDRTFCAVTDCYLLVTAQNYVPALGSSLPGKVGDPSALSINERCRIILTGAHKWDTSSLLNVLNHWILWSLLLPGWSRSLQAVLREAFLLHHWSLLRMNPASQSCLRKKREWDKKDPGSTEMQLMEGLVLNAATTTVEKYYSCYNSQKVWVNDQTKYSLRRYSGVTRSVRLGSCLVAAQSHFLPCLWRVAAVERAVGCESVFLEKSVPAWYLGNPDLSLHHFHLILCLETSYIVFVSLQNNLRFSWQRCCGRAWCGCQQLRARFELCSLLGRVLLPWQLES